jgi:hypothetical protein
VATHPLRDGGEAAPRRLRRPQFNNRPSLCLTLRLALGLTLGFALCLTLGLTLGLTLCLALGLTLCLALGFALGWRRTVRRWRRLWPTWPLAGARGRPGRICRDQT